MCASRWSLPVLIEDRSISAVTEESVGCTPVTISPEKAVNLPRTLLTIICRTEKPTSECTGSMVQVPATYPGMLVAAVVSVMITPVESLIEYSTIITDPLDCQTLNDLGFQGILAA